MVTKGYLLDIYLLSIKHNTIAKRQRYSSQLPLRRQPILLLLLYPLDLIDHELWEGDEPVVVVVVAPHAGLYLVGEGGQGLALQGKLGSVLRVLGCRVIFLICVCI